MSWINEAIENADQPIIVDVSHLSWIATDSIEVMPLNTSEYQGLKHHPAVRKMTTESDKQEALGLIMICQMMSKCDDTITWTKLQQIPLTNLGHLSQAIMAALGNTAGGGGVLGELEIIPEPQTE